MDIVVILDEDWEGVYTDGTLYDERHSINWREFIADHVGKTIDNYSEITVSGDWLTEEGGLPFTLKEFKQREGIN